MPVTIRRAHRDVLRRQVVAELRDIGEIHLMLDTGKGPLALGLRRRYEGYMRLLDDLGWREDDPGEEFAITADPIVLMRALARLRESGDEIVEEYVDEAPEARRTLIHATFVIRVCSDILHQLARSLADEPLPDLEGEEVAR